MNLRPQSFEFVATGDLESLQLLLKQNPNEVDRCLEGDSLLSFAVAEDQTKIVEYLLSQGACPNKRNVDGSTALTFVHSLPTLRCLLANEADPTHENRASQHHSIHSLAQSGRAEELELLLKTTVGDRERVRMVNALDSERMTPLMYAIQGKSGPAIEVLLRHGANPDYQSEYDTDPSPFVRALWSEEEEVIKPLVRYGASIELNEFDLKYCEEHYPKALLILNSLAAEPTRLK